MARVPYIVCGERYMVTEEERKLLVEDRMLYGQCWIARGIDGADKRIDPTTFYFKPMTK